MHAKLSALFAAALLAAVPAMGQAIVVNIDQFIIDRNGTNYFTDNFANGTTPSQESIYTVSGAFPNGAESGGLLTLDSSWGAVIPTALGQPFQVLGARYNSGRELRAADDIVIVGLFNLVVPTGPSINGYGVQVLNAGDRLTLLTDVIYDASGAVSIRYFEQDFANGTITLIDSVPLAPPSGFNQIALAIANDGDDHKFFGAYAYCNNGICLDDDFKEFKHFDPFDSSDVLFARFRAYSAVPEPGSLSVLVLGLAALLIALRRGRSPA